MTKRLTDEEIGELNRHLLEEDAGPWHAFRESNGDYGIRDVNGLEIARIYGMETDANHLSCSDLIISMRNALPSLLDEVLEFRARKAQEERVSECSVCGYMDGNGGYYRRPNCKECGGMP